MISESLVTFFAFLPIMSSVVSGHGRLIEPPSRSSMWRFGFNTPHNYNDNQLFCGGFANQVSQGGACGVCGDPAQGPFDNEAGGVYATGTISRCYQVGITTAIPIEVQITANHKGYFEFRLCEHNNTQTRITQECLNEHVLRDITTGNTRLYIDYSTGIKRFLASLPEGLTCTQCVLQWRYHTGNSWGCDGDSCCVGCGAQEEFYGCSDVAILPDCGNLQQTAVQRPRQTTRRPRERSSTASVAATPPSTSIQSSTTASSRDASNCQAVESWSHVAGMDDWCVDNCRMGMQFCPPSRCTCGTGRGLRCKAIGQWENMVAMDYWCDRSCKSEVPYCPQSRCSCDL